MEISELDLLSNPLYGTAVGCVNSPVVVFVVRG